MSLRHRRPAPVSHRVELNRLPLYLGLPGTLLAAVVVPPLLLLTLAHFERTLGLLLAVATYFAVDGLQRLARKHPGLPLHRLRALRYPETVPAVCEWTLT